MKGGRTDRGPLSIELIRAKGEKTESDVAITWINGFVLGGVSA